MFMHAGFCCVDGHAQKEEKVQMACKRRWTVACFSSPMRRAILIPRERSRWCDLAKRGQPKAKSQRRKQRYCGKRYEKIWREKTVHVKNGGKDNVPPHVRTKSGGKLNNMARSGRAQCSSLFCLLFQHKGPSKAMVQCAQFILGRIIGIGSITQLLYHRQSQ